MKNNSFENIETCMFIIFIIVKYTYYSYHQPNFQCHRWQHKVGNNHADFGAVHAQIGSVRAHLCEILTHLHPLQIFPPGLSRLLGAHRIFKILESEYIPTSRKYPTQIPNTCPRDALVFLNTTKASPRTNVKLTKRTRFIC